MSGWMPAALGSALLAACLLGAVCGLLGTFVVVRRMALTGDMLSHAVLPGVVAGLAWTASRDPLIVLACAAAAGLAGSWTLAAILRHSRLKPDAALALVLSVFFAIGIAMISRLQPAGVQAFLFGQVAAIDRRDLQLLLAVTALVMLLVPLGFRTLTLVSFDPGFARLLGLPARAVDAAFFTLLTAVIVVAMQAVGVILVTAMLVTPAAAARFCTHSLPRAAALACLFGATGGMAGVWISSTRSGLSTGPLMALAVTLVFLAAATAGPRRGWIPTALRKRRAGQRILREDILKRLWMREENGQPPEANSLSGNMKSLIHRGLVERRAGQVRLTGHGRENAARLVRSHRLWERYLTDHAAYKADHVHDEAERAEHWIDDESLERLSAHLGHPSEDPHGREIPRHPDTATQEARP
jgi:manganese/zinc/iron transport system permease protein